MCIVQAMKDDRASQLKAILPILAGYAKHQRIELCVA